MHASQRMNRNELHFLRIKSFCTGFYRRQSLEHCIECIEFHLIDIDANWSFTCNFVPRKILIDLYAARQHALYQLFGFLGKTKNSKWKFTKKIRRKLKYEMDEYEKIKKNETSKNGNCRVPLHVLTE